MYGYVFNEEEEMKKGGRQEKKMKREVLPFFLIAKREQDVDSRICPQPSIKNKKHNQLYLGEESQCIFRYYG